MKPRVSVIGTCTAVAATGLISTASPALAQGENSEFYTVSTILAIGGIIYMIPTIVAFYRGHPNRWLIFVINLAFGGTVIGWFGPLIWAMMAVHRTTDPTGTHGGESGLNILANDVVRIQLEPSSALPPPLPLQATAAAAPPREPDVLDRLERLKRLHDAGAVDDEQFRRMRDRLVAEMG